MSHWRDYTKELALHNSANFQAMPGDVRGVGGGGLPGARRRAGGRGDRLA